MAARQAVSGTTRRAIGARPCDAPRTREIAEGQGQEDIEASGCGRRQSSRDEHGRGQTHGRVRMCERDNLPGYRQ